MMTEKETKDWLNRAYCLEHIVSKDKKEVERIRSLIGTGLGIDYEKTKVQTSTKPDAPYTKTILMLTDIKSKYEDRLIELFTIKNQIREKIEKIDDNMIKAILISRHLHYMKWIDIYLDLHISRSKCFELYKKGLEELRKHIN